MTLFGPTIHSTGPSTARIMLIADFPNETESEKLTPFVGFPYYELRRMLNTLGMNLHDTYRTHVFSRRPDANNVHLFGTEDLAQQVRTNGPMAANPITYMDRAHQGELDRLYGEIASLNPSVVVPLGPTACWALGLGLGLKSLRGSVHTTTIPGLARPLKVLPTYDPATILRQWDLRVIALADLEKANIESASPDFNFDNTELWLNPTLQDLLEFDDTHMAPASICAADIETKRGQITAISFAPTSEISLAIPFWIEGPNPNYWATPSEEALAWSYVRKWMERSDLTKVFQNGIFDLTYLQHHCNPRACTEDSMLAHHSLFSELQKGLGFLGSIYANTPSWKKMRTWSKEEMIKREE